MAKYTTSLYGDYENFKSYLKNEILSGSVSASLEAEHETRLGDVRCCVQVFERYSAIGSNRLSLSITLLEREHAIQLVAVTSGGSQALFFKLNTFGESAFLEKLVKAVEGYPS